MKTTSQSGRCIISTSFCAVITCLALLTQGKAEIEPDAKALVESVATKLQSAKTLRVTAKHKLAEPIGVGSKLDKGPLLVTVKRPNLFYVMQSAKEETREMAYDGKEICIMHPKLKHHALEPLKADTIEQFADQMEKQFGFRPPLAELLSEDMATQLFKHVTSAKVVGNERVGWTRCKHLHFVQEGMTGDLWVGIKDTLPRRYMLTFTNITGNPTWDIRLSKWELDKPVDDSLFTKRPASDSTQVKMLKTQ